MASISLGLAALIGGGLAAGGSVASGVLGSNAAKSAASAQQATAQQGIDFQKQVFNTAQQNQAPFLQAGQQSIAQIMSQISAGKYGTGSLGQAPQFTGQAPSAFTAPTLAEAQNSPGYQFTAQQGSKGILQGASAAGGAISGGTLKALDSYNSGLANNTYNDVFNRSLSTYNAGLSGYDASLRGYGAQLAGFQTQQGAQQQEFNQELAPAQLGEGAVQSINSTGTQASNSIAQLLQSLGNSQAAGIVGSNNALTGGIAGGTNAINGALGSYSQAQLLQQLLAQLKGPAGTGPGGG